MSGAKLPDWWDIDTKEALFGNPRTVKSTTRIDIRKKVWYWWGLLCGGGGCATERLALWMPASLRGKQGSKLTQQKSYFSSFLLSFALEYWWWCVGSFCDQVWVLGLVGCKGSCAKRGVEREGGEEGREKGMGKGMGSGAGRGKFKGKPTGRRHFSTPEEMGMLFHHWFFFWGGWLFVSCFLIRGGRGFALHRSSRRQLGSCNMYMQDLWKQWFLGTLRIFLTSFTLPSPPSHAQQLLIVPLFVYELHLLACSWHMLKASEHANDHHYSSNYSAALFDYYYYYFKY